MNLDEIIGTIKESELQATDIQVKKMETEEISLLGPMNMLAFD